MHAQSKGSKRREGRCLLVSDEHGAPTDGVFFVRSEATTKCVRARITDTLHARAQPENQACGWGIDSARVCGWPKCPEGCSYSRKHCTTGSGREGAHTIFRAQICQRGQVYTATKTEEACTPSRAGFSGWATLRSRSMSSPHWSWRRGACGEQREARARAPFPSQTARSPWLARVRSEKWQTRSDSECERFPLKFQICEGPLVVRLWLLSLAICLLTASQEPRTIQSHASVTLLHLLEVCTQFWIKKNWVSCVLRHRASSRPEKFTQYAARARCNLLLQVYYCTSGTKVQ